MKITLELGASREVELLKLQKQHPEFSSIELLTRYILYIGMNQLTMEAAEKERLLGSIKAKKEELGI